MKTCTECGEKRSFLSFLRFRKHFHKSGRSDRYPISDICRNCHADQARAEYIRCKRIWDESEPVELVDPYEELL